MAEYFFLGIGGIGMSGLAWHLHHQGHRVSGYDRTATDLTRKLEQAGMAVLYEDNPAKLPNFSAPPQIVWTPAVPRETALYRFFEAQGLPIKKRAVLLAEIARQYYTIAVAGTHGKTSTCSAISHILRENGVPHLAFIGGIQMDTLSNYITADRPACVVVEADEYDRSFLQLDPDVAIVTAVEPDHLDIYGTMEEVARSYQAFASKTKLGGKLVASQQASEVVRPVAQANYLTYGLGPYFDYSITHIAQQGEQQLFEFFVRNPRQQMYATTQLAGKHNIMNLVAAVAAVEDFIPAPKAVEAIAHYQGVKRRFEIWLETPDTALVDDYAHHPTEIRAAIEAARSRWPDKNLLAIFQPHLYTRTRDFAEGFAESLSAADEVWLLPVYPAREEPIPGVGSSMIAERCQNTYVRLIEKDDLENELKKRDNQVVMTLGAGDIDLLLPKLYTTLQQKLKQL